MLTIENLRTVIAADPPVRAVDGVSLMIPAGKTTALVGESGCGKTMLALSLTRLFPKSASIQSGRILFRNRELTALPESELRRIRGGGIAYIFQDPMSALNPVLSIGFQLQEAIDLHRERAAGSPPAPADLLRQVRIADPERRLLQYSHQLSGGERQRVMIAMALAGRPELLVADEPTSALDVSTQAELFDLLTDLKSQRGMALLLITHDLRAVARRADRIAVMYAGRIVEWGESKRVLAQPSHPYTQALLRCLPPVGRGKQTPAAIPGSVPDLAQIPAGCPFHPRCPEAFEKCRSAEPKLRPLPSQPTQQVSCWARETTP
ncbi:MAG: peptide ABC transporter ATP-binding protein [Candidatus Omnitrophica bacterium CG11_big_fil_rev_8_21_14_0_20_64_10]|nr:MAG: peptide ABC transporter ATP-binding protein [Candidatus Omnitrophica bacterium CG11_big_fil_rev_8_21_14_0_20_64_10]